VTISLTNNEPLMPAAAISSVVGEPGAPMHSRSNPPVRHFAA
jgi:hypothetical protein